MRHCKIIQWETAFGSVFMMQRAACLQIFLADKEVSEVASPMFPLKVNVVIIVLPRQLQDQMPQLWAWVHKDMLEVACDARFL